MKKEYLKYKNYAHFDKKMSVKKAKQKLCNDDIIKNHGFFPFIHYTMKSKKLESVNGKIYAKKDPKKREIYYCSHFDRYIYQDYAHKLGIVYNEYTIRNKIDNCVGAYRIDRGKCNIDFSYEMFNFIKEVKKAIIIVGDFTSFFDNLNHKNLKKRIEIVLGSKLNDNIYKIFKSLTKYKYIDIADLYDYYTNKNKKRSEKYYMKKLEQLMTIDEFKKFIKAKNTVTGEKYLKQNDKDYGIVQGSPMSGLLANIYMIDFDKEMQQYAEKHKGKYLRYSDDFMLVIRDENIELSQIYDEIQNYVYLAGQIELEKRKTNIYEYNEKIIKCINKLVFNTPNTTDIINFLGFSFDGKTVSIRNKTISKYNYKLNRKIKQFLRGKNKIKMKDIYNKFSIQGESKKNSNGKKGNFMTYVKRAEKVFTGEEKISKVRKNSKKKITERIGVIKQK